MKQASKSYLLHELVRQEEELKAKVQEGVQLSNPHRTSLGLECSLGSLGDVQSNADMDLATATAFQGNYFLSVAATGVSTTQAKVTLYLSAFGPFAQNDRIVYMGECGPGSMVWSISVAETDIEAKYRPKL